MRANTHLCVALSAAAVCICIAAQVRAQDSAVVISEDELVRALRAVQTPLSLEKLLKANRQTLTPQLWQRVMDVAARTYYENHDQSFVIYGVALRIAEQLANHALIGRTHYHLARSYSGLRDFDKAKTEYLRSDAVFVLAGLERDRIYILSDLGTIAFLQEQFAEARTYSEASIELAERLGGSSIPSGAWPDSFGVAGALSTLGELSLLEGNIDRAIERFVKSMHLFEDLNRANPTYDYYLVDACAGLGRAYTSAGDYRNGLKYLNRALGMAKGAHIPNLLNSIGFLYMEQENYAQASAQFTRSLKLYEEQQNRWESARVLLNLAVVQQRQGNVENALRLFRQSLSHAKSVNNQDVVVAALEGIGVMLSAQGLFEPAFTSLQDALSMARQLGDRQREAEIRWRESQTLLAMGNYSRAADVASAAREIAMKLRITKLTYLCTTTLGLAYDKEKKVDLAIETLTTAIDEIEHSRAMVAGTEEEVELFFEQRLSPYHTLIELFLKQGRPIEALLYTERAKARVLLDVVGSNRTDLASVLTPNERTQQKQLNERIFDLNERIKKLGPNDRLRDSLLGDLDHARLEYQAFQDSIYVLHPHLRIRRGRTTALTEADISELTTTDTAYLEYVVTNDRVLLFVTTREASNSGPNVRVYPIALEPSQLREKVNLFHDRLANRHPDYTSLARELYSLLVGPAEKQLQGATVCIVPDAFLWNLPFQALMTNGQHFLIEDKALYYAPSLSVLYEMEKNATSLKNTGASLIALGNPVIGKDEQRNEDLCPLPEAETEVNSIARSFNPTARKILIGREATEKSFRALAPTYSTIHLATHGVIDNRQPLYSHLLLTETEGDIENDGLLEAREIMNMNLRASLAVLSACETANGTISPGEGVVGMSWAFFVAGTRSMLVSQWKVNSASTSQLMMSFYQGLEFPNKLSKSKKAEALRRAAIKLLKDRQYRHPFYWAGFVLIGNSR